jgi:hypothetical protein
MNMKLYDVELGGEPLGTVGFYQSKPDPLTNELINLHTNWYCGIRRGDYAFKIEDSIRPAGCSWKQASFAIWKREIT